MAMNSSQVEGWSRSFQRQTTVAASIMLPHFWILMILCSAPSRLLQQISPREDTCQSAQSDCCAAARRAAHTCDLFCRCMTALLCGASVQLDIVVLFPLGKITFRASVQP
mmetsp:Transcript_2430/g.5205  ORF Transcript_2430/g.5205 Transcript_2430/m.5205 type:complete len:110 (-) Transcript_2430:17-346(-)